MNVRHPLLLLALLSILPLKPQIVTEAMTRAPEMAPPSGAINLIQGNQAELTRIESYARGLDRYIKRNAQRARYFADLSSPEAERSGPQWQEIKTRRALDKAWQEGKTYTSSNVWFHPTGELAVALFTYSSPSGDWAQYITNYYRRDGTLAKTSAELRTFMGDIIRINDRFYDGKGRLIKEQTRFLDLKTRRPKRVNRDEFMDMEAPLYKSTGALPFYGLLRKG